MGALSAYRSWSLEHPEEFGLAYGTPVPGYVAPPERTVGPGLRIGRFVIGLLERARVEGRLAESAVRRRGERVAANTRAQLEGWSRSRGYDLPGEVVVVWLDIYVRVHGLVAMEVFGQLRPITREAGSFVPDLLRAEVCELIPPRAEASRVDQPSG